MIAKIGPRYGDVASLIRYVYGAGRTDGDPRPRIVAGWRTPAELEPPRRPGGRRDFRRLAGLLDLPVAVLGDVPSRSLEAILASCARPLSGRDSAASRLDDASACWPILQALSRNEQNGELQRVRRVDVVREAPQTRWRIEPVACSSERAKRW